MALLCLVVLLGAVYYRSIFVAVMIVLAGGGLVSQAIWKVRQLADYVALTDDQIEARTFGGNTVRLQWSRIGELQEFRKPTQVGIVTTIRLLSLDRAQQIVFDSQMPKFESLVGEIRTRIPHAITGRRPSFKERYLWQM